KKPDIADWFYVPSWKRSTPSGFLKQSESEGDERARLIFADECGVGSNLAEMLREQGRQVITVTPLHDFSRQSDTAFTINPLMPEHYLRLFSVLREESRLPGKILHLWGITPEQHPPVSAGQYRQYFEQAQSRGLYSLLYLTQAMPEAGLEHDVVLEVVTRQAQEVSGTERVRAEKATVLGACKVIPQEHGRIKCRAIDVELTGEGAAGRVAAQLLAETSHAGGQRVVAYRGGHRWEQCFERVRVEACKGAGRRVREGGVYLITGGTGGVGLALGGYLARAVRAKLVLVSRGGAEAERTKEAVKELEELGAEVLVLKADVSDEADMRRVVRETLKRYERLDGVIHAAGVGAMTSIQDMTPEDCDVHFLPKVRGLLVLEEVLKGHELDFAILTSSLSSVLGGLGFFAYASSNLFMDSYVRQQERISSIPWTSVNWDGWNFSGKEYDSAAGRNVAELSMTPAEGAEVFERILSLDPVPQIVVSTGSLDARLAQWVNTDLAEDETTSKGQSAISWHSRPDLNNAFSAPRNELEATIVRVWQELLGIEQIGIHDNFFELGGHSLLATQLISQLRHALRVEVPVRSIFEKPTVAELAASVEELIAPETREPSIETPQATWAAPEVEPAEDGLAPTSAPGLAADNGFDKQLAGANGFDKQLPNTGFDKHLPNTPTITHEIQAITRRDNTVPAPLSFAQQRLWFFQQLEPGSIVYNYPKAVRFKGALDVAVLRRSLDEVVRRHEMLRTTFQVVDGRPVQVISPFVPLPFPLIDLQEYPAGEREALTEQFITSESQKLSSLEEGPLLRASLLRLDTEEHVLLLVMHHIITDAWSLGVLIHEMATLYEAYSSGEPSPLGELPVQYADYAVWQREWLQGEVYERQLEYWRKQLEGAPGVLELPTDRPRPPVQTTNGAYYWFDLDREIVESLKRLSRKEGATLFMTLLAAFKVLLYRYTGQTDIVIGTPIAGRNRAEIEGLIGFFVNTLVLRTDLSGEPSFRETVRREREECLSAYTHQDMPFEKLVEELQPERDLSRTPIFQVMFLLENASLIDSDSKKRSLTFTPVEVSNSTSKFDLTLGFSETSSGLAAAFEYNSDLFDHSTISDLSSHLTTLLRAVAANPDAPVSRLPLLSVDERRRLLRLSGNTACDFPSTLIPQVIEQQAALSADLPALQYDSLSLSYAELNARANRLAHFLRAHSVGPESIVGLCLERSPELVVSILATLKAGGAYLPLEPTSPAQRLRYMMEDARCRIVLTVQTLASRLDLEQVGDVEVISLDTRQEEIAAQSDENPPPSVTQHNAAYLIYTSGSTGLPKGVINSHDGLRNRLAWMQQRYQLTRSDAVLQKTPFSFDVSVWEFLWPLMAGARLVLAQPGGHQDSAYLSRLIQQRLVTVTHFVPSMLRVFLGDEGVGACESLRLVVCSGEALSAELVAEFHDHLEARLENLYGP
ncbi:MAG: SDR family NAD(P)-dependent oxidoreductase, partial [Pyrinomonadaceae bacterium]